MWGTATGYLSHDNSKGEMLLVVSAQLWAMLDTWDRGLRSGSSCTVEGVRVVCDHCLAQGTSVIYICLVSGSGILPGPCR